MDKLTAWMERFILPFASKVGSQKHLVALRDAFIGTMPATMAGSVAVMLNAIFRDLPPQFFKNYDGSTIPIIKEIILINGYVWNGTLAIAGIIFAFSWGYNLAKAYGVNDLAGGIVSLSSSIAGLAFTFQGATIKGLSLNNSTIHALTEAGWNATKNSVTPSNWGWLSVNDLNSNFFFTAMIIGFVSTMIFCKLMLMNITIKLPESVPPAVSKAFAAIIPATAGIYFSAIFYWLFAKIVPNLTFLAWIQKVIAEPLLNMSQGFFPILLITFFVQAFWFFGIHGVNVLAPILEGVFGVAQIKNINLFQEGGVAQVREHGYLWVRGSFDAYAWVGGSGGTLILIIAVLIFSKRSDYLAVSRLSLGPGIFNINEPIMFGMPIVLNPILCIPFVLAPMASVAIGYGATLAGLVNPVSQSVIWVTPPFLLSFLATGADWRAPIVTLVCVVVSFLIWLPFILAANKMSPEVTEN